MGRMFADFEPDVQKIREHPPSNAYQKYARIGLTASIKAPAAI